MDTPASRPSAPPSDPTRAWLIERGNPGPTHWWCDMAEWWGWTTDATLAIRFASRAEAEEKIAELSGIAGVHEPFGRATEHVFLNLLGRSGDGDPPPPGNAGPLRGGVEFFASEGWREAAVRDDCSAGLRSFKMDPDDERVRVRTIPDDDALLTALASQRAARARAEEPVRVYPENYWREVWHDNCPDRGMMRHGMPGRFTLADGSVLKEYECLKCGARCFAGVDKASHIVTRPYSVEALVRGRELPPAGQPEVVSRDA